MPLKRVTAQIGSTEIKFENTWFHGAKLFVNGQEVATNNKYFALSKSHPVISVRTLIDGTEKLIEVFAFAIFTVKLKICLDGKQIAGDQF